MNILIIEDDFILAQKIEEVLRENPLTNIIQHISSYEGFLELYQTIQHFDIILVDILLSSLTGENQKNGLHIIDYIRIHNSSIPIIVMSGISSLSILQRAFDKGASDYIVKPFRPKELRLRILKWFYGYLAQLHHFHRDILHYHELSYVIGESQFYYDSKPLYLSKNGKLLFLTLFLSSEQLVSSQYMVEKIWGDRGGNEKFLRRNIRVVLLRLKRQLENYGDIGNRVLTIRGEGYILKKHQEYAL